MNALQLSLYILLFFMGSGGIECHFSLEQAVARIGQELQANGEMAKWNKGKKELYADLQKCVDFDLHNVAFIEYCLKVAFKVMTEDNCRANSRQTDACIFSTHYLQRFTMSKWAQDQH